MPPQKRPLAEADANVSKASEPARKKISTGNTNGGKENRIAPDYDSKTVAELKEILKERSISHTGKKSLLIDRLTADDAEHGVANNRTSSASKVSSAGALAKAWHGICQANAAPAFRRANHPGIRFRYLVQTP